MSAAVSIRGTNLETAMGDQGQKTTTLRGLDDMDLNRKQWEWQSTSEATIAKVWPDERLPLQAKTPEFGTKLLPQEQFLRRIDYYEK
jgi:hypothetical protein